MFDNYKSRINSLGVTNRDRIINRAKHDLLSKAPSSPDYKKIKVNGEERFVMMHRSDTVGEKFINCMPNEIVKFGDYVEWEGMHFLVTNTYLDDDITLRAVITRCNRIFRWQDPVTLQINERWGVMYRPYNSSSFGDEKLQVSDREFKVYVAYDEDTAKVDLGTRFILEHIGNSYKVYEITCVDIDSRVYEDDNGGYIIWNIEQAQYNPEIDNIETMISNYQKPYQKQTLTDTVSVKITHLGDETVKIGGSYKRFSYEFITTEKPSKEIVKWELKYDDPEHIDYVLENNDIKIKALAGAKVNSEITLILTINDIQYAQLQIKVVNII